ncbi:ABC transporter permease [candidate division KSB1 bacterium]|nr:ABC transporter permease [candidate division KSB1 bacterium]
MNFTTLLKADVKNIRRDPMLVLSTFAPVLILLLLLVGFPALDQLLQDSLSFPITAHYAFACVFMLTLIPMLIGMVYGFILLDERDEGVLTYFMVTPLGKRGYLFMRLLAPVIFSFIIILLFIGITRFDGVVIWWKHIPLALITALQAPIVLLFLGGFAGNKVEGMAIAKGFGILFLAIPVDYFFPAKWTLIAGLSPLFWTARGFLAQANDSVLLYILAALVMHAIVLLWLYKKFLRSSL